jgi:phospholipid N-methyltransferase
MSRLSFFLNYLSDPRIATLAATPQTVVKKVCRGIDFSKDMIVVEYGPGDGAYTRYLLNTMTRKSRLIAIETNKRFKVQLKKIDDRRLTVANDDARNVLRILRQNGLERVSYVISGIPFSLMNR